MRAMSYPCFCLCFGFSQMIITALLRRMTLHLLQIFRTEDLIFIVVSLKFLNLTQDFIPLFGKSNRVFEVCRSLPICRNCRPSIFKNLYFARPKIHHRLNSYNHPDGQARSRMRGSKIRHLRVFMKITTNPMPYEIPNDREAG